MGVNFGLLPRLALIELLLGQALSASTVLWTEVGALPGAKCDDDAGELVDMLVAAMVQLDELNECLKRSKTR